MIPARDPYLIVCIVGGRALNHAAENHKVAVIVDC